MKVYVVTKQLNNKFSLTVGVFQNKENAIKAVETTKKQDNRLTVWWSEFTLL